MITLIELHGSPTVREEEEEDDDKEGRTQAQRWGAREYTGEEDVVSRLEQHHQHEHANVLLVVALKGDIKENQKEHDRVRKAIWRSRFQLGLALQGCDTENHQALLPVVMDLRREEQQPPPTTTISAGLKRAYQALSLAVRGREKKKGDERLGSTVSRFHNDHDRVVVVSSVSLAAVL